MSAPLRVMSAVVVMLVSAVVAACGVVGPPIPPEDVGVSVTIRKQKAMQGGQTPPPVQEEKADPGTVPVVPVGQDEELPPLRPVGTR